MLVVKNIRIDELTIGRAEDDTGQMKFAVTYALVSEKGTVVAKQKANTGYGEDLKIPPSAEVVKAIRHVTELVRGEIETLIGLKE